MPILPTGSLVTIGSTNVLISSCRRTKDVRFFERLEYDRQRLLEAPDENGARPKFVETASGLVLQGQGSCTGAATTRSTKPNDEIVDDVYKRWDIVRYDIQGHRNLSDDVDALFTTFQEHRVRLARFENHIRMGKAYVSKQFLISMQSETFSYLTDTSVDLTGNAIMTELEDVLITAFVPEVERERRFGSEEGDVMVLESFSIVLEKWTLKNGRSTS